MIQTPYYLIDTSRLLRNMERIERVRRQSGARILLALKCFATWSVFDLMRPHMDGTTSSSLYEVRLGREKFGGETHAYSVAWADHEIDELVSHADKVIFNSLGQFRRHAGRMAGKPLGLRLNPGISSSSYDLADPTRPFSRLGEADPALVLPHLDRISGFMIHNNCENRDFDRFSAMLMAQARTVRNFTDATDDYEFYQDRVVDTDDERRIEFYRLVATLTYRLK